MSSDQADDCQCQGCPANDQGNCLPTETLHVSSVPIGEKELVSSYGNWAFGRSASAHFPQRFALRLWTACLPVPLLLSSQPSCW